MCQPRVTFAEHPAALMGNLRDLWPVPGRACEDPRVIFREYWCGREDSNFHGLSPTTTSTLRVYQFRHDRT